jgi:acyl carrier protein
MDDELINDVIGVVVSVLGIEDRAASFDASSGLLGSLPELDSMVIVEVVVALEDHFGMQIDEDEITGEAFETFGSLARFVEQQRAT